MKKMLVPAAACLLVLAAGCLNTRGGESVTVHELEGVEPSLMLPCAMLYGDQAPTYSGGTVNVSLYAGSAQDPHDAVRRVKEGRSGLKEKYSGVAGQVDELNTRFAFGWGENIHVKYRTSEQLYEREGWYVTVIDGEDGVSGEYFLSNHGILMPAEQTCTRFGCCT